MMKRIIVKFLTVLCLASVLTLTAAQEVKRVLVLPFNGQEGADIYDLGLAAALQRGLNVVNGFYVPPIADTLVVTQRLIQEGNIGVDSLTEAFDANIIISGEIIVNGNTAEISIGLTGTDFPNLQSLSVSADLNNPALLSQTVATAILDSLEFEISQTDRDELSIVLNETPSLPSLNALSDSVVQAATANISNLEAASQLDSGSSWVVSEYARALALAGDLSLAEATALSATELASFDIEAWVTYGVILRAQSKFAEAEAAFRQALSLNPSHASALLGVATNTQDTTEAKTLLEAALLSYPRLTDAYLALADLEGQESPQRALQVLRRGSEAIPETVAIHEAFMQVAFDLGDTQGALSYLQSTLRAQTKPPAGLFALSANLISDFPDESLEIIREGRASYPNNASLAALEAASLERQGDFAAAEAILLNALVTNPSNLNLNNRLAVVQAKQGKLTEAKASFEAIAGDNATAQYNLAQLYLEAGENDAAISTLEPLLASTANDADLLAAYGLALGRSGRYQQALTALDQALAANPNQSMALQAKAQVEQQLQLSGGQQISMSTEASNLFSQGQNALSSRDFLLAADLFSQARALDDNGLLGFYEGFANYFANRPRQAISGYSKALESFPDSDIVLNNIGLAQLELGRFDLALEHLSKAISINPNNDQAHLNLGLAYYRLDEFADAVSQWETALNLNPALDSTVSDLLADARAKVR